MENWARPWEKSSRLPSLVHSDAKIPYTTNTGMARGVGCVLVSCDASLGNDSSMSIGDAGISIREFAEEDKTRNACQQRPPL